MRGLALFALLVGCGVEGGDRTPRPDAGPPWVEVGTGLTAFERLDGCPAVEIIAGHQGAFHVIASLRGGGFDTVGVAIDFTLTQAGQVVGGMSDTDTLVRGPDGIYARLGSYAIFDGYEPARYADRRTRISVWIRDRAGVELSDTRCVVPRWR